MAIAGKAAYYERNPEKRPKVNTVSSRPKLTPKTKLVDGQRIDIATGAPYQDPKTFEPTTISDTNIRDTVIPELNAKIDKFAETGQYQDNLGNKRNADGSIVDDQFDDKEVSAFEDQADSLYNEQIGLINSLQAQTDADTARQLSAIKSQFNVRESQLKEINRRNEAATDTALLLGGSSRYTTSGDDLSAAQVRSGIMELAELDALEQSTIAEVKNAQASKNFQLASEKMQLLEKKRQEKIAKATALAESMAEANNALREKQVKQSKEMAIVDLYQQGITDPADMLDFLNRTEDGRLVGDISLKEIEDTLKIISPDDALKGATSDYKTFNFMKDSGEIPESWNYFDYKAALKNVGGGSGSGGGYTAQEQRKLRQAGINPSNIQAADDFLYGGGGGVEITAEDRRILVGAGLFSEQIDDVERSVNDFGIEATLEELETDEQKKAVRKVYNVPEKVNRATIEQTVDIQVRSGDFNAAKILKGSYTEDELKKLAKDAGYAGWWGLSDNELDDYLESKDGEEEAKELYIQLLEDQYRAAGMLE